MELIIETLEPWFSISTVPGGTHLIISREGPLIPRNDILSLLEPAEKLWSLLAQLQELSYSQIMHNLIIASLTSISSILPFGSCNSRISVPQASLSHFRRWYSMLGLGLDEAHRGFWQDRVKTQ